MTTPCFDGSPCGVCGSTKRYQRSGACVTCQVRHNKAVHERLKGKCRECGAGTSRREATLCSECRRDQAVSSLKLGLVDEATAMYGVDYDAAYKANMQQRGVR